MAADKINSCAYNYDISQTILFLSFSKALRISWSNKLFFVLLGGGGVGSAEIANKIGIFQLFNIFQCNWWWWGDYMWTETTATCLQKKSNGWVDSWMSRCSIGFIDKNEMQGNVNDRPAPGCGGMHYRSLRACAVILRRTIINRTLPLRTVIDRRYRRCQSM